MNIATINILALAFAATFIVGDSGATDYLDENRGHSSPQHSEYDGQPATQSGAQDDGAYASDHMTSEERAAIQNEIDASIAQLATAGKLPDGRSPAVTFEWPLATANGLTDPGYHWMSGFMNHATPPSLMDFNCGARTYGDHGGSDFDLWPFPWYKMDRDQVLVVAAAPGIILLKTDGNDDRNCGPGQGWQNGVIVMHADNSIAWYVHFKKNSLTSKNAGDSVVAGEFLGVVGSSGTSYGPHLHFEVQGSTGDLIDPYAGACNTANIESWWIDQHPYYDSAINALVTGPAAPYMPSCPQTESPNARRVFADGERIYFSAFYRDELSTQLSDYTIRRPDDSVFASWQHSGPVPHQARSHYTWPHVFTNAPTGIWTFAVDYNGVIIERAFEIVDRVDSDGDAIEDHLDNCIEDSNADQVDADGDGFGNYCDADFNNDGIVNVLDLGYLRAVYFSTDEEADLNTDGVVNTIDLGRFKALYFDTPGPSAFAP